MAFLFSCEEVVSVVPSAGQTIFRGYKIIQVVVDVPFGRGRLDFSFQPIIKDPANLLANLANTVGSGTHLQYYTIKLKRLLVLQLKIMSKEKLFQVGIKALIENKDGKLLIFRADTKYDHIGEVEPYWDIAGGRIKEGQTIEATLKREVEEETGISKIDSFEFFTAVISKHEIPLENGSKSGLVLMIYRVKLPENSKIQLSPEHDKYEWVDPKVAGKRLADKYPPEFTSLI